MIALEQLTLQVCAVARRAGIFIRSERQQFRASSVECKHAHDYVSYVDKQSEQLIVDSLRQLLPQAGFITEEGLAHHADEPLCWVVDPLDGTTNFIHQHPPYAVSIALMQHDEILLGVVYEVCADECFYAWQGGGAWMTKHASCCDGTDNQQPHTVRLHTSDVQMADALLCLQLPYNSEAYNPVVRSLIARFYGCAASVRMLGSAAIALCYVAAGRLDGYAEQYIGQWDYMAGALIVSEAGGRVTDYAGSTAFTHGNSVVAANALIHDELLAGVSDAVKSH